jgi:hypothetical protein
MYTSVSFRLGFPPRGVTDCRSINFEFVGFRTCPAYLFWSIITSLLTALFYFSVWELGLSGAEAALFVYLSPVLLGITPLRNWAVTRWGRVTLRTLSLVGLAAYKLDDPLDRLWAVIAANVTVLLSEVADWTAAEDTHQGFRAFLFRCTGTKQAKDTVQCSVRCWVDSVIPVKACESLK